MPGRRVALDRTICSVVVAVASVAAASVSARGSQSAADSLMTRVGDYVERYYARARTLLVEETVVLQPLRRDLSPDGFARRLVYETRLEWDPGSDTPATVVRTLVRSSGPALGPPDQPDCLDPRAVSPEPLAFLLPERQTAMRFSLAGLGDAGGRAAVKIEYRPVKPEPPRVEWAGQCGHIDLPGRLRGRIWADPRTAEVLRFEERLVGPVDIPAPREGRMRDRGPLWFTVDRADTTIEYRHVTFHEPLETVLLPARVDSISVIVNSGVPRLRVTQQYSNYRRFVTESRVLP